VRNGLSKNHSGTEVGIWEIISEVRPAADLPTVSLPATEHRLSRRAWELSRASEAERSVQKGAHREIFVVDGYVDSSIFQFLLSTNSPKTCRILTNSKRLPKDFLAETKVFVTQHRFAISIRSTDTFHDREILVDQKQVFVLGASIKDAGKRASNIVPVEAGSVINEMIRYAEQEWRAAQEII
jgi:hypothetical protein